MRIFGPADLNAEQRELVMERAAHFKASRQAPLPSRLRVGALYFNPSLRTRASFEQAVSLLGGNFQTLNTSMDTWGLELDPCAVMDGAAVENVVEAARVLGRYFHILGGRSFRSEGPWSSQRTEPVLSQFAEHAGVPIISLEGTQAVRDAAAVEQRQTDIGNIYLQGIDAVREATAIRAAKKARVAASSGSAALEENVARACAGL